MEDLVVKLTAAQTGGQLKETSLQNINAWLTDQNRAEFHKEIEELIVKEDWAALNDAFYTQIELGTAGIRGRTGLGSARINSWTVGTAAQGLANYIISQGEEAKQRGVLIGSDTRITSPQFVDLVCDILTSNGINVYRFPGPRQVGMFSFGLRLHKAQAGIYISASHNPPTDNGLKIYWEDGAQVLPPHDKAITQAVKSVTEVKRGASDPSLITTIGDDFDSTYRARLLHESVSNERDAKIVYSPFHGTGQWGVLPVLQEAGFKVTTVEAQMAPDGNFPNVPGGVPNPENRESNSLTAQTVLETGADLGLSTDPDADRIGLVVPKDDQTVILDGNQTVALLSYFICQQLKEQNKLPKNGFLMRTLVTTPLVDDIAADFGLKSYVVLVGFKYFGATIKQREDFGDELFIYGGEESFGSLKGSYARDKDASAPALIGAEMVSWLKANNRTIWDYENEMHRRYGYYQNDLLNFKFEGAEGFTKMQALMNRLRADLPQTIGDWPVHSVIDRQTNEIKKPTGEVTGSVEGHTTNMLIFNLSEDGRSYVAIRPSGTEPKVKVYITLYSPDAKESDQLETIINGTKQQVESLKAEIAKLIQ